MNEFIIIYALLSQQIKLLTLKKPNGLIYMIMHLLFSAQGLFFLSTAWISGSFFSFSSINSRILKIEGNKEKAIN